MPGPGIDLPTPLPILAGSEDDFEALKQAALQGIKGRRLQHTVVLPGQQVGAGGSGGQLRQVTAVMAARHCIIQNDRVQNMHARGHMLRVLLLSCA